MSEPNTTQSSSKQDENWDNPEHEKLMAAGLVGFGLIIIQAFIPLGMVDIPVSVSILAFAVSIPLLAVYIFAVTISRKYYDNKITYIPFFLGAASAGVGITAAFWEASWIAGIVCTFSGITSITLFVLIAI
jgi:hypothetical protein